MVRGSRGRTLSGCLAGVLDVVGRKSDIREERGGKLRLHLLPEHLRVRSKEFGGLAHIMPNYAVVFAIAMLSSAGLPLLNGFVGEFTIMQGAFEANKLWAAFAVLGIIFSAAYLLWLYQRTMLGEVTNEKNRGLKDLNWREWAVFVPLIIWAVSIGVYPKPYFDILDKPVAQIDLLLFWQTPEICFPERFLFL